MTTATFIGEVRTEWLVEPDSDRRMRLLQDFSFIDPNGKHWFAPAGSVIDGASIPRMLWSLAGSPYTGDYRRASVLHDVACSTRSEDSKTVHRMFYDAMICDGVPEDQAVEFYAAVRLFGPSWSSTDPNTMHTLQIKKKNTRSIKEVEAALDAILLE